MQQLCPISLMYIASDVGLGIFRVNGIYESFDNLLKKQYL